MRGIWMVLVVLSGCGHPSGLTDAGDVDAGAGGGAGGGMAGGSGGGGCVPKTCADYGATCGNIGDGCGGTANGGCGDCTAPDTCGGGGSSNACGSPGGVGGGSGSNAVTFRYQYAGPGNNVCPGVAPSSTYKPATCSVIRSMTTARLDATKLNYASCNTAETGTNSWLIDCTGNCLSQTVGCVVGMAQQQRVTWSCTSQPYEGPTVNAAVADCAWTPP